MANEQGSAVEVRVERGCISSGICVEIAPESFELVGVRARPRLPLADSPEARSALQEAVEACPVEAILVLPAAPDAP
ncbi:ferredoxin [Nocardioides zeae]|uniref:Ferredoxin n=2 Tax=Nocardioides zeae TaxID=1457234 RepID=A0AAJ1U3D2_9ACTN|nr:ferredoxin [Nocardioides zeae]MDQ1103736.1 ferredoxin [Nocardioides zeae]MDR6176550.1 ferredoxin [Nocardioides zeae]MDR6209562.1 ferredoxin [Nocardioides zeae]